MSQTTTAIYIYIGFDAERTKQPKKEFPASMGSFMDVTDKCDDMSKLIEDWYDVASKDPEFESVGCFDYEVTEQMGAWLYKNFDCSNEAFTTELERYVAEWKEEDAKRLALWAENDKRL